MDPALMLATFVHRVSNAPATPLMSSGTPHV